jgi:hypothetical protein
MPIPIGPHALRPDALLEVSVFALQEVQLHINVNFSQPLLVQAQKQNSWQHVIPVK